MSADRQLTAVPRLLKPSEQLIIVVLLVLGTIAVDTTLPASDVMRRELGCASDCIQAGFSSFFIGFALGQLGFGPLSDVIGRRSALLIGLVTFVLASMLLASAQSSAYLPHLRLLQAIGAASGPVLGRALIRDYVPASRLTNSLSLVITFAGFAPMIAVPIGGIVADAWGWRAVFYMQAVIGTALFAGVALIFPVRHLNDSGFLNGLPHIPGLLRGLLLEPWIYIVSFVWSANLIFVVNSKSLFRNFGELSPTGYSLYYSAVVAGIPCGAYLVRFISGALSSQALVFVIGIAAAVSTLAMTLAMQLGVVSIFLGSAIIFTICVGATLPLTVGLVFVRHTTFVGTRSAVLGAFQYTFGALAIFGVNSLHIQTQSIGYVAFLLCLLSTAVSGGALMLHDLHTSQNSPE
ncbi:MFS transporter [Ensifer sp. ENS05]|uniref:MFS transporter n=1 Tax=Ensifer sp. ENS05 TaxID=2769277 RepID=UPI0017812303|nr:MFS transporter [Ensifer sp. ENS05]MBD9597687.1 MFS transporter [Ensifer sp. ENS05]